MAPFTVIVSPFRSEETSGGRETERFAIVISNGVEGPSPSSLGIERSRRSRLIFGRRISAGRRDPASSSRGDIDSEHDSENDHGLQQESSVLFTRTSQLSGGQQPDQDHDSEGEAADGSQRDSLLLLLLLGTSLAAPVEAFHAMARVLSLRPGGAPPAAKDAIDALPVGPAAEMLRGRDDEGELVCVVCQEIVAPESRVMTMPCAHWFHEQCLRLWLAQRNTCPVCRHDMQPTEQQNDSGLESVFAVAIGELLHHLVGRSEEANENSTDMAENQATPSAANQSECPSSTPANETSPTRPSTNGAHSSDVFENLYHSARRRLAQSANATAATTSTSNRTTATTSSSNGVPRGPSTRHRPWINAQSPSPGSSSFSDPIGYRPPSACPLARNHCEWRRPANVSAPSTGAMSAPWAERSQSLTPLDEPAPLFSAAPQAHHWHTSLPGSDSNSTSHSNLLLDPNPFAPYNESGPPGMAGQDSFTDWLPRASGSGESTRLNSAMQPSAESSTIGWPDPCRVSYSPIRARRQAGRQPMKFNNYTPYQATNSPPGLQGNTSKLPLITTEPQAVAGTGSGLMGQSESVSDINDITSRGGSETSSMANRHNGHVNEHRPPRQPALAARWETSAADPGPITDGETRQPIANQDKPQAPEGDVTPGCVSGQSLLRSAATQLATRLLWWRS